MKSFLEDLAARRRLGMKPGLETIRALDAALGSPASHLKALHVAGTNGKGAVCAILDAALRSCGFTTGRYTSPHLVKLNERFFLNGAPVSDDRLEAAANLGSLVDLSHFPDLTFFEALTAVAFRLYAEERPDWTILETGLGGRLDATNICHPAVSIITRIGLDHCDWLGDTVEKIAAEKAGIIKPGVPVVLGENLPSVRTVVESRAQEVGAPFFYAPDLASNAEVPREFSLPGAFNRENAVTAIAALRVLGISDFASGFSHVVWPGRFQRIRNFMVDGAHNPPAAHALAEALLQMPQTGQTSQWNLICGFCGDKDVAQVLAILKPFVSRGFAVRTSNPRSLEAEATSRLMSESGIPSIPMPSLSAALEAAGSAHTLICGSLFLAGEALVALNAYPWPLSSPILDPAEALRPI